MEKKEQIDRSRVRKAVIYLLVFCWAVLLVLHLAGNIFNHFIPPEQDAAGNKHNLETIQSDNDEVEELQVPQGEWDIEQ
jgi:hypothetical protein